MVARPQVDHPPPPPPPPPHTRPSAIATAIRKLTPIKIDADGLKERLFKAPIAAGNYGQLRVNDKSLFLVSRPSGERKRALVGVTIGNDSPTADLKTLADDITMYQLSQDGKKLMIRKTASLHIVDAAADRPADLTKKESTVDLSAWTLGVVPREEWRQMFDEAWRLERDYFYDRGMHGVDWKALKDKYKPLVERVTTRAELSDLIAQMVAELAALHIYVRGGDLRSGDDDLPPSSLGAVLERDVPAGGWVVKHVYASDPDEPERVSPLRRPEVNVKVGDVIEMIDGVETADVRDTGSLLRRKANQQVLLKVKPVTGKAREVIVRPLSLADAADLRYHEWEHTRRLAVETKGEGKIGYVHLRAMGGGNFTEWAKGFYPVFTRDGLIIDMRNNRGGNIDSWLISRLLRKPWFFWSHRVGQRPLWNPQYAFRGHIVVLCDQFTASDGEAFTEGVKRLKLGTVIGTRTWGGEIWLSASNFLVDRGIATSAEMGVFSAQGEWLIEGHGVEPDIVVDNLPHATFKGEDAQLDAAVTYLKKKMAEEPVPIVKVPPHPNKAFTRSREGQVATPAEDRAKTEQGTKPTPSSN